MSCSTQSQMLQVLNVRNNKNSYFALKTAISCGTLMNLESEVVPAVIPDKIASPPCCGASIQQNGIPAGSALVTQTEKFIGQIHSADSFFNNDRLISVTFPGRITAEDHLGFPRFFFLQTTLQTAAMAAGAAIGACPNSNRCSCAGRHSIGMGICVIKKSSARTIPDSIDIILRVGWISGKVVEC